MYKIFVNLRRYKLYILKPTMKKFIIILSALFLFSCGSDTIVNECFENIGTSGTINLTNPQFIELQVPLGNAITNLNGRNILIINRSTRFQVFDLECPERDCSDSMTFEDDLNIICPCSGKDYNSLNGSPNDGEGCFVLEYNVTQSGSTLQISR